MFVVPNLFFLVLQLFGYNHGFGYSLEFHFGTGGWILCPG